MRMNSTYDFENEWANSTQFESVALVIQNLSAIGSQLIK